MEELHADGMELGDNRKEASRIMSAEFAGDWDAVPVSMREQLREVLPKEVDRCVQYDLKKDPSRYVLKICLGMGKNCKVCFLPGLMYLVMSRLTRRWQHRPSFPIPRECQPKRTRWTGRHSTNGCGVDGDDLQEVGEQQILVPPRDHHGWHGCISALFQSIISPREDWCA